MNNIRASLTRPYIIIIMKGGIPLMEKSLLDCIENIDQQSIFAEMEVCNAISSAYVKYAKMSLEYSNDSFVTEAFSKEKLKNFGSKILGGLKNIWEMIKHAFSFIAGLISKFFKWIKSLFTKKTKSANQIAEEVLSKGNGGKHSRIIKEQVEEIPAAKNSEIHGETVKRAHQYLMLVLDSSNAELVIEQVGQFNEKRSGGYQYPVKSWHNQGSSDMKYDKFVSNKKNPMYDVFFRYDTNNWDYMPSQRFERSQAYAMHLITEPEAMSQLQEIIDDFKRVTSSGLSSIVTNGMYKNIHQKILQYKESYDYKYGTPIKYKEIGKVQSMISKLSKEVGNIAMDKLDNSDDCKRASMELLSLLTNIQMSFNAVSGLFNMIWVLDPAYDNSVSDIKDAALFAKLCIESGIPPKYLRTNLYFLLTEDIVGNQTQNAPIWGQTRAVFIPQNQDVVYKVALSGSGVVANKTEYIVSKKLEKTPVNTCIALTEDQYESYAIIEQEKCPSDVASEATRDLYAKKLKEKIKNELQNIHFPLRIDSDIHCNNIGFSKRVNDWVAIDYGWTQPND